MQNTIQREVLIQAPKEKIYEAIANPEKVVAWFPNAIEGKYTVDENIFFVFDGNAKAQVRIIEAKPYDYFAFRWVTRIGDSVEDVLAVPNTLVEFRIQEDTQGECKVIVTESGYEQLPIEVAEAAFERNSGGWDYMLGRLEKHFQAA
jgi:uncharacterized protein YndB with AHSA1/START domain